jgi:outer membrane lipoprotein carrier protein
MRKAIAFTGIVIVTLLCTNAMAGMSAKDVALKVQALYDKTSSLKSGFVQTAKMKTLDISEQDRGLVYMKKDGRIRWEYKKPKEQLIVSDGKTIWFYLPSDKQVIIGSFDKSFKYKPTQTFLTGMGRILEDFNVKFDKDNEFKGIKDAYVLQMLPKKEYECAPAKIVIAVDKKNFLITKSIVIDKLGNHTEIDFNATELNTVMPDSLFTFTPPKDAEVIHSPVQ